MRIGIDIKRAWAAGFFDGEGSVGCYPAGKPTAKGSTTVRLTAQIAQVDREVLDKFQRFTGIGRVTGPFAGRGNSQSHYRWSVEGFEQTQQLFCLLWSDLSSVKRADYSRAAREFLSWAHGPCKRGHQMVRRGRERWCPTCRSENALRRWKKEAVSCA